MTSITVDLSEMGSLTGSSVPVSVLKLLLHRFRRSFTAVSAPNVVDGTYQVSEFCKYRSTPKRLSLRNENQRIYDENLRDTLHLKNSFLVWLHFSRARDSHKCLKRNIVAEENDKAAAQDEDSQISDEIHKPDMETDSEAFLDDRCKSLFEHPPKTVEAMHTILDIPGDQRTKSYALKLSMYIHIWQKENNGSETDACTSLATPEDKGTAASRSCTEEYNAFYVSKPGNKQKANQWVY